MFGDTRRRQINLGGVNTTTSQAYVLAQVHEQRQRRQDEKRAQEAALQIQARWRAYSSARQIRVQMNQAFDSEPIGTVASTRYLVFGGGERQRLIAWTNVALEATKEDEYTLFKPFEGPEAQSWLVLLRQLTLIMLKQAVANPKAAESHNFLQIINMMVAHSSSAPTAYSRVAPAILDYLLQRNLYSIIASCIRNLPITTKSTPPGLVTLSVAPFKEFSPDSRSYKTSLAQILIHILTLPLFPNRIPLTSLTTFSAQVPFQNFQIILPHDVLNQLSSDLDAIHLLANLHTFIPPRYTATSALSLTKDGLEVYITLLNHLLSRIPVGSIDPPKADQSNTMDWKAQEDSDEDDRPKRLPRESTPILPVVDAKTITKLSGISGLTSQTHITSLLNAASKSPQSWRQFVKFVLNIGHVRPKKRESVLNNIAIGSGGVVFKQLWRDSVRNTPLGGDASGNSLKNTQYAEDWPPLMLLIELYTQALLTMGDDEFFSITPASNKVTVSKNPFSVGEVIALSRKLLNIVFPLTWNEDSATGTELVPGLPISWETVRERLTKCLQAIHARDSRRPFTPPRHWLVTDQLDVNSFVEAAIVEEETLDDEIEVKDLTKREIAYISPRLRVLNNIPFSIPFEHRVSIFRSIIRSDKIKLQGSRLDFGPPLGKKVVVRRNHVAQDGFDHLNELGEAWKGRLAITFVDQWGQEEAGIDGGGVFKEFLTSLSKEVFDTDRGLWLATKQQELYPNSHSYAKEPHQLNWYRFIGRVLGKALYEDILVDVAFAGFFLAKWLGKQSFLDDLASLDPELYQGLIFLKNYPGNPEELSLDFSITETDLGVTRTINLKQDGSNIPVTRENRLEYIYLISHYRLTRQIRKQSEAFFEGLSQIIKPRWLRMFNQQELRILVGGAEEPIDVDDLRSNTLYGGLYDDNHPTVQLFWRVVKSLDVEQRRLLLRFVTSCARPPLLGFRELSPKFAIRDAGTDTSRLPTASTCVNLLKLPLYRDEHTLRRKLIHAINSGAGFDLS